MADKYENYCYCSDNEILDKNYENDNMWLLIEIFASLTFFSFCATAC